MLEKGEDKGQVTIFIIIAIFIVAVIVLFFVFRGAIVVEKIPASIEPVYNSFLMCLEEKTLVGIDALESQGGYIEMPDFEPGSAYMPFSNQLDFLGNPIPYWYYVSGNNIQKEQVPSKSDMENFLEKFVEERARDCDFENYYEQGFEIVQEEPNAEIKINDQGVEVALDMGLSVNKEEDNALIKEHKINIRSNLGKLYDSAKKVYEQEQETLFLENYAVDTLRLYAPVDGVEITCSPQIWNGDEVFDELENAIEANTFALKVKGGDYLLKSKENEYFVVELDVNEEVRFLNSKNWPHAFEVSPSEGSILMATPVGNQPGLGILGFCYVPYHFVYDVKYPVLVQVQDGEEIFQFPVAVVVQGNNPREPLSASAVEIGVPELCKYKNTITDVQVYDNNLNPVDADVSFECLGETCEIGKTSYGNLRAEFPQCVNGFVVAKAEGFKETKKLHSSVQEGSVSIFLDKLYEKNIELKLDGKTYNGQALIMFSLENVSKTISYPEQKSIELSGGQYEIQVSVYRNSSLKFEATAKEECVEVPVSGIGSLFGVTKEKCFTIEFPEQTISSALAGGGKESYYILESELQNSNVLEINAGSLPLPNSLEQLQMNYVLFEDKGLDVTFR